jgi:hypothetical protein
MVFWSSLMSIAVAKSQTDPKGRDDLMQTRPFYDGCVNIPTWVDIGNAKYQNIGVGLV